MDTKSAGKYWGDDDPNPALHRIAARLRFLLNANGYGWAARGELER